MIKNNEISSGVTIKEAKRKAKEIFETVVRPQVEKDAELSQKRNS